MFVAAYSRNTERGIAQRAAQRVQALPAPVVAPEPPSAPVAVPEPETPSNLVEKINTPENVVVPIRTPFAETRRTIDLVARMHGSTLLAVMSKTRLRKHIVPRQAAICAVAEFFASKGNPKSLPELGRMFGGLDHTTVLHAQRKRGYR